jgi:1,4-dihydroxy-2-naphthoyl-CoA hydrolase
MSTTQYDLEHASAFLTVTGLTFTQVAGDRVEGYIDLGPDHHTPWGVIHGGVCAAAVERAASVGASTAVADRGQLAVGINNSTDFPRSKNEGRVAVLATPVSRAVPSSSGTSRSPTTSAWSPEEACGCRTSSRGDERRTAGVLQGAPGDLDDPRPVIGAFDRPGQDAEGPTASSHRQDLPDLDVSGDLTNSRPRPFYG